MFGLTVQMRHANGPRYTMWFDTASDRDQIRIALKASGEVHTYKYVDAE